MARSLASGGFPRGWGSRIRAIELAEGGPAGDERKRLTRGGNPFKPGPGSGDAGVNLGQGTLGGLPVGRLGGQAVVEPLLSDLAGFLPSAESILAPEIGHRCSGVAAPQRRGQRAWASPPFRLEIMTSMMAHAAGDAQPLIGRDQWPRRSGSQDRAGPSVEIDGRAGHVGRAVGQEVGRQVGELPGPTHPAQRDTGVLRHLAVESSSDRPAASARRRHWPLSTRPRSTALTRMPCPPRSLDAALVMASPAAREAVVGSDPAPGALAPMLSTLTMDPPPAAIRCGHCQAGAANGREHLEVEVGDPFVVGDLIDPSGGALARVVHQAIEAGPAADGRIDESFKVGRAGDVGLYDQRVAAGVPQPLLGGGQSAGVPPADGYPGALLDEAIRERRSQPVGPAGDEHDLVLQVQIHRTILAQPPRVGTRLRVRARRCPARSGRPGG